MSFISRTGNLAETPKLREGDKGPYTFARVLVTDRIRQKDGSYTDGPATPYDVAVSGDQAKRLVATAKRDGNVRVTFAGRYRVTEWKGDQGSRIQHEVQADDIALSFRGQDIGLVTGEPAAADTSTKESSTSAATDEEPADIYADGVQE